MIRQDLAVIQSKMADGTWLVAIFDGKLLESSVSVHSYEGDADNDAGLRQLSYMGKGIMIPIVSPTITIK
jgi:hypothetical protein